MAYVGAQTEELRTASEAVQAVMSVVRGQALPQMSGHAQALGSEELSSAADDFLRRWEAGLENLVADGANLATCLEQMATALQQINAGAGGDQ